MNQIEVHFWKQQEKQERSEQLNEEGMKLPLNCRLQFAAGWFGQHIKERPGENVIIDDIQYDLLKGFHM